MRSSVCQSGLTFWLTVGANAAARTRSGRMAWCAAGYGSTRLFHRHGLQLARGQIEDHETARLGPVQRPGVDHPGRPRVVLLRLVRVAVEEQIKVAALLDIAEKLPVVAVQPGELAPLQFQVAERLVERRPGRRHR